MIGLFIASNPAILWVIFAILIVILVVFIIRTGNMKILKIMIHNAVDAAEAKWGTSPGPIKYVEASTSINAMLPWYLRIVFTATFINKVLEEIVKGIQKATEETVPIMTIAIVPPTTLITNVGTIQVDTSVPKKE